MKSENVFYGTREEWLETEKYIVDDIYDDSFSINFDTITIAEQIEKGFQIDEPKFETDPF